MEGNFEQDDSKRHEIVDAASSATIIYLQLIECLCEAFKANFNKVMYLVWPE